MCMQRVRLPSLCVVICDVLGSVRLTFLVFAEFIG